MDTGSATPLSLSVLLVLDDLVHAIDDSEALSNLLSSSAASYRPIIIPQRVSAGVPAIVRPEGLVGAIDGSHLGYAVPGCAEVTECVVAALGRRGAKVERVIFGDDISPSSGDIDLVVFQHPPCGRIRKLGRTLCRANTGEHIPIMYLRAS